MLINDLIVAYLTLISVWPFTLAVIALAAGWLLHIGWRVSGIAAIVLLVLVAVSAWQFEHDM